LFRPDLDRVLGLEVSTKLLALAPPLALGVDTGVGTLLPREDLVDDVAGEEVTLLDALLLVESSALRRGNLDLGRGLFS